ncbi:FERM domain-containing protein 5, partial [Clarias magur]
MVKCLIRIKTKVNIHLRMINHCYRDVKVRVLTMGPRLLGNVLGALPIIPALPESSSSSGISLSPYGRSHRAP